jgi:hypothetical protein
MGVKFGFNAQLEYNTSGVGGAGSWETLSNAKDVTLSLETAEADATTRANNGWRATVAGLKDGSVEFEMVWDTGDAGFTAVKDAFMNNTVLGLKVLGRRDGRRTRRRLQHLPVLALRAARRSDHRLRLGQDRLLRDAADLAGFHLS